MNYYKFNLTYPYSKSISVKHLTQKLLIPRKWRHYLRVEKNILINNHYLNFNDLVNQNDQITLKLTHVESNQQTYPPSMHKPDVVYEDNNIIIINKPAGQKTHPNLNETDTALNDVAFYLGYSPYIVHRLDMLTNGLLLIAKNPAVVPILNKELTDKTLQRNYFARVKIKTNDNLCQKGIIEYPIGQDPLDPRKRIITPSGKRAITHYELINLSGNFATYKLTLETGRTHQIRVHLAAINLPIIGDPLYNPEFNDEQLQLQAYQLSFIRPFSFERQTVSLLDN